MPILQMNFKLNVSTAEYQSMCDSVAQAIADVPGLRWKVWILNEQEMEAGGIYLFADEESLNNYLSGPIVTQIKSVPQFRDVTLKRFDVMDELTALTRGPSLARAAAAAA